MYLLLNSVRRARLMKLLLDTDRPHVFSGSVTEARARSQGSSNCQPFWLRLRISPRI